MKLVPLGDKVVLKQLQAEETTKSGIVLPFGPSVTFTVLASLLTPASRAALALLPYLISLAMISSSLKCTTTATVLAQAMINEGMKNLAAGANPIILRKGMKKATECAGSPGPLRQLH